ncbi:DNA-3-methyladenine glycosylase I [Pseudofrankia inefficax]|uniref:DNA-3-methyladenine glycosylase I n=1 Tax=Pseudofrankia inefficax (strain DSM 45817 / CECT 9037 / DDB 130130 / EuI1c) TaxID=298654 RepID=E3J217_PSEI1|nr:DNA-3-methyladenine glycosylase I [Pseudofrankia inefficax]
MTETLPTPAVADGRATGSGGPLGPGGPVAGPDGLMRCPWGVSTPDYLAYHDEEWGRPVRDTVGLFERLSLEAFQSGLSWLTILRKREGFRRAFAGFDPATVAAFGPADAERLLTDASIVRNRRKIEATIVNARAILALDEPLEDVVWSFQPDLAARPAPRAMSDLTPTTPESVALSKALRKRGLVFIGPTTAYAMMQACGLVNDHLADCVAREAVAGPSAG